MSRNVSTVLAGAAVFSLFFVPDTPWPWLLLPLVTGVAAFVAYVAGRGDQAVADTRALLDDREGQ